ncbi:Gfo/Idh/MocA family oxidoreductase [Paenibacillus sp. JX-17]|uniref:Gfo/Idh/MocA family oxidoreductase n=1 Tax=Paenibacillus lacisoli TaxID=3064525 RepID=A0ABT9CFA3_9BACL|nr:Gfo/Idh/MocA family oxidoreductase [Paenibacillus sp. JX-17]MDO7907953.1 Gfo/Idh/MocA family oxidoreductase [Paenibacillus sp. JX-17]
MSQLYRVAVAGCGQMANTWIEYAKSREDTEIVALVDLHRDAAQRMAVKHQLKAGVYTELAQAIQEQDANLVFDVTVPSSHFEVAAVGLQSGCHVFAEKPLAESMKDCLQVVRLSQSTGRSHAVMQNRRFDPRIRSLRRLIEDGTIGKPGFIGADFFIGPHFGGFRDSMDSPLLMDMAIHTFDQARFIMGADAVTVYCEEFNPPGSWYAGQAGAVCIFTMSDGSVFNYRGLWCAEGAPTSWEASWRITGEYGTAMWDGTDEPYAEVVGRDGEDGGFLRKSTRIAAPEVFMDHTFHNGCLDEMFNSLKESRAAETHCEDNSRSMAMVLGAIESARTGRRVNLSDMMKG